jgi:nuclear receptor co-repressor 1
MSYVSHLYNFFLHNMIISLTGVAHQCVICKLDLAHYGLSRPLTKGNCELYGLNESDLKPEMRVCSSCRCKSVRRRYTP